MRDKQQVTRSKENGQRSTDTHPAFGAVTVRRQTGSGSVLFQSDVLHRETIVLSISAASRITEIGHDWVHPTQDLVTIEMSPAQWGAVVSSIGSSPVPVTLRRTESDWNLPDIPYEPRIAENLEDVKGKVAELLADAHRTFAQLQAVVDDNGGKKALREAMSAHASTLRNAEPNAVFAVATMNEAAEAVVAAARSDIESYALQAAARDHNSGPVVEAGNWGLPELEVGS